jgi:type II secretory pathway predicted ATPase ExeA
MSADTMHLQPILDDLGVSQADLARAAKLSRATVSRIASRGEWPAKNTQQARRDVLACLVKSGAGATHLAQLHDCGLMTQPTQPQPAGEPASPLEIDTMLLENVPLSPEARKAWALTRNPFADDINARDDVWSSANTRYVRAALLDAAQHHGFMAVVGESGSGKTTLREDLEQRILDEQRPIIIVKPYVLDMEPNDQKGKVMKSGRIAEAIARALAPSLQLKSSPESRFAQVHGLLRDSCRVGNRHLLVIEEAHRMPLATLKHLKGFMELKDGLRRLMGVCLIGQPELDGLLSEQRPEIREIVQRCEKVRLEPLDADLESYLRHKFERVGANVADVLAPDAYDALRARMIYVPRNGKQSEARSICYPLVVNNRLAKAMNAAARAGWPKVDANVVNNC